VKVLLQHAGQWLFFSNPVEVLTARTPSEIFQTLEAIALRQKDGLWAAGFISYEAAGAFDDALKTRPSGSLPLLQFGLFERVEQTFLSAHPSREGRQECLPRYRLGEWKSSVNRSEYAEAIAAIKERIAAGDTYQVNYTFRLNAGFEGDPFAFFCDLISAQQGGAGGTPAVRGGYGAYIEADEFAICSASPELFFELKGGVITSRPMKGTATRGLTFSKDWKHREALLRSEKDRAENIMIVDMIRNDIGRIAETGSVETVSRFDVEKYPTVWQMTSTVAGKTSASFSNVWKNLFPCASITGAPKAKTMEIIQTLEKSSRGIYTGSIGFIDPDGNAQFNVAIRTAVLDRNIGTMEYGIGGGIVWDSDADLEYDEALSKAAILTKKMPEFQLLETMLWENGDIFLLERHLQRLAESAEYFDFQMDLQKIREALGEICRPDVSVRRAPDGDIGPTKIRLLLSRDGRFSVERQKYHTCASVILLATAKEPVDSGDVFLYHKTTNRSVYEKAKADFPDADDVLLYNERGEVTESCIANVVVEIDGRKITPPVSCGLLAGTFRDELLAAGEIEEGMIALDDLKRVDSIWLINSVRKWQPVRMV
jgi:para-aminobenzoate synthetase/4-amino-4-deoxychorismate lyase